MATLEDVRKAILTHTEFIDPEPPRYIDVVDMFTHELEDGSVVTVWIESYGRGYYTENNMDELVLSMWRDGQVIKASSIMVDDYSHADFLELVVNSVNQWLAAHLG